MLVGSFPFFLSRPFFSPSSFMWSCLHPSDTCTLMSAIFLSLRQLILKQHISFVNQIHTKWSDQASTPLWGLWFYSVWHWDAQKLSEAFQLSLSMMLAEDGMGLSQCKLAAKRCKLIVLLYHLPAFPYMAASACPSAVFSPKYRYPQLFQFHCVISWPHC